MSPLPKPLAEEKPHHVTLQNQETPFLYHPSGTEMLSTSLEKPLRKSSHPDMTDHHPVFSPLSLNRKLSTFPSTHCQGIFVVTDKASNKKH